MKHYQSLLQLLAIVMFLSLHSCESPKQTITTETLLHEMLDKRAITYYPEQTYAAKQFSSYERASDNGPDHFSWYANMDCSHFLREDTTNGRIESVLYDAEGPGCVTRIWITGGGKGLDTGILRFYIDGSSEPALEGAPFELIGYNKVIGTPLSAALSMDAPQANRGHNFYLPIPYAKHCKITYESEFVRGTKETKDQMFYYNINYRTYHDKDTKIESFTKNTPDSLSTLIAEVNKSLLAPEQFANESNKKTQQIPNIPPSKLTLQANDGAGTQSIIHKNVALSRITLKLEAKDMEQALRSTVMKLEFDDVQTAWVPVGDFFATGHIWRDSKTWATTVKEHERTLETTWIMPFKERCDITFNNLGDQEVTIDINTNLCPYEWNDRSMYFGASWYQLDAISTGENKERRGLGGIQDINYITLKGKGVYVGDALSIYNPVLAGHWKSWWGEGDEKIYIDGETFPSHFGTGTEDYYGYAWCRGEAYSHPFIAQPIGEGNLTTGYTVNSRMRALDAIPFTQSLKLDMELWHWVKTLVNFAPTTYYYMHPSYFTEINRIKPDIESAKAKIPRNRYDIITSTPDETGLLEAEDLRMTDKTLSQVNGTYDDKLSGGHALNWHSAKQGNTLDAEFDLPRDGTYDLTLGLVEMTNLATVDMYINNKFAATLNGNTSKEGCNIKQIKLTKQQLKAHRNTIQLRVRQTRQGRFALDYIRFTETKK